MKNGATHEFGYSGIWRQVTSLAENASPSVRADAGDTFKSSISHTWINDKRDYPLLPNSGYFFKTVSELAGWGPLKGDTAFWKSEAESQVALPFGDTGITLTAGLRGGLLYPMTLGGGSQPQASRINDRFQLGGPTDVRGFKVGGIGPHDGADAAVTRQVPAPASALLASALVTVPMRSVVTFTLLVARRSSSPSHASARRHLSVSKPSSTVAASLPSRTPTPRRRTDLSAAQAM